MERVFTDVVILSCDRQDHSISQRWLGPGERSTHIPVLLGRRRQPQPNLINKRSSPVPQLSEMKMILRGSERSDGGSTGRNGEGHEERERERRRRRRRELKVEVALRLGVLKAKPLSTGERGDNTPVYILIRTTCPATLSLPDQRAEHLYAGDSLTLIIKNLD